MRTLRSSIVLLALPSMLSGCSSMGGPRTSISPKMQTVASIGDKPLPVVSGEPGAAVAADVEEPVRAVKAEGRITGRVVDAQGDPVPDAQVRVAIGRAAKGRVVSTTTNKAGNFTLTNLRPGTSYTLIAESQDDNGTMMGRAEAEAPEKGVKISLAPEDEGATRLGSRKRVSSVSDRSRDDLEGDDQVKDSPRDVNAEDLPDPDSETTPSTRSKRRTRAVPAEQEELDSDSRGWRGSGSTTASDPAPKRKAASSKRKAPEPDSPVPEGDVPVNDASLEESEGTNPLPPAREREHSFAPAATSQSLFAEAEAEEKGSARQTGRVIERVSSRTDLDDPQGRLPVVAMASFGEQDDRAARVSRTAPDFEPETPTPTSVSKRATWEDLDARPAEPSIRRATMESTHNASEAVSAVSATAPSMLSHDDLATPSRAGRANPEWTSKVVSYCRFDPKRRQLVDFRLPDVDGRPVRFQDTDADLILLDFWGTWCDPCLKSVPHLIELQALAQAQQGPKTKKLKVIGIACEQGANADRMAKVKQAAQELGINYQILMSGMDTDICPVQQALQVQAFPTLILVDRQGHILWRDQGATTLTLARLDRFLTSANKEGGWKWF